MSLHPGLFYPTSSSGSGFCSLLLARSLPLPPLMDRIRLPAAPGCFTPRNAGFHRIGDVRGLEVTTSRCNTGYVHVPPFRCSSSPLATSPPDSSCPSALFLVQRMVRLEHVLRFALAPARFGHAEWDSSASASRKGRGKRGNDHSIYSVFEGKLFGLFARDALHAQSEHKSPLGLIKLAQAWACYARWSNENFKSVFQQVAVNVEMENSARRYVIICNDISTFRVSV